MFGGGRWGWGDQNCSFLAVDQGASGTFKLKGDDKEFYRNVLSSENVDDRLCRKS